MEHDAISAVPRTAGFSAIRPGDPRYESLLRGANHRFSASPEEIHVITTAEQAVSVVGAAARSGSVIAVRSGGHGFEDFAADPRARVLLDMSEMDHVGYDEERDAFVVEAGSTLGHLYRVLFKGWGVTIPGGECPEVGVGGHLIGGGYGPLSRRYGSVVDFLYGVEVVVVDKDRNAELVVGTRDPDDPHHDLWWAHTGGGGGNFGVVTRFWLRSAEPGKTGPGEILPPAPRMWRSRAEMWPWESLDEETFGRLLSNFGSWFENNSSPGSPGTDITGFLHASPLGGHGLMVGAMADDDVPGVTEVLDGFFDGVRSGVDPSPARVESVRPWLEFAAYPGWGDPGDSETRRIKIKAAYMRRGFSDRQVSTVRRHLTTDEPHESQLILIGYGGRVNTVEPHRTATAQRDSILKAAYMSVWGSAAEDERNIRHLREFYRDVYAATGGVPVPDDSTDGSYINYPDKDLADPVWNRSGVPWTDLYYKDNYPRLQRVKERYDPGDLFRHSLSIVLPEESGGERDHGAR